MLFFIFLVTCVRSDSRFADYLDLICSRCGVRGVSDCDFCFDTASSPTVELLRTYALAHEQV